MPEQTAKLQKVKECKHSTRFDFVGPGKPSVVSSVYVLNAAYEALGSPDEITVTIS